MEEINLTPNVRLVLQEAPPHVQTCRALLFQTDPAPQARSGIEMGTPTPIHRNNHHPITIDSDDEGEAANITPLPDCLLSIRRHRFASHCL